MFFVFLPSYMDAEEEEKEEEAAAVRAAGGEAAEGDGERERRGGGGGGEEAWRAAAPPGSGRRHGASAGTARASRAWPRSRGRRSRAAPVGPRVLSARGSLPGRPPHSSLRPGGGGGTRPGRPSSRGRGPRRQRLTHPASARLP